MKEVDGPGLIGHMARSTIDGRSMAAEEIEAVVLNVIIGGLDTTQAVFSSVAVHLGRNPARSRELAEHPDRIRGATSEYLRVFASAGLTGRRTEQDVTIDGYEFRAGETVLLFWGATNFDPNFIADPFELHFTRQQPPTLTFATGPHRCLGQQLAKLELEMLIEKLVSLEGYELIEEEVEAAPDVGSVLAYMRVPAKLQGAAFA
ncbi:MAG: cytochrome P450 [Burkholderia sp.]|nr:cytochrome P450 [Burkholderia sp.]